MTESKRIIAVVGATGGQGGGLVKAILDDPQGGYAARAITRNPDSDKAQALAGRGAEVVAADLDDEASLRRAFEGAHGAFCVTNFWEHFSPEKEGAQAANMARAARAAGLKHVLWSTLEDSRTFIPLSDDRMPTLQETYKVPHFDGKGQANARFTEADVPTTFFLTSYYWENLIHFGMGPKRGEDGKLAFVLPMGDRKLPSIAVGDIGACAYGVFKRGQDFIGQAVGVAGEHLTGAEMAASLTRALGEEVVHQSPPFDVYRGFGFPGADDLGNMFQFNHDFADEFCAARSLEVSRALHPGLLTFDAWLERNKEQIPVG